MPMLTVTSQSSLPTDKFKKILDVNVMGSVYVAKYVSLQMARQTSSEGVIIFVSSIAATEGQRGQIGYGATKGAIDGIILPMARDLGRYGIRVCAIAPGVIETPLTS